VRFRSLISGFGRWMTRRAWTGVGAVAAMVATGPKRRVLAWTTRIALFLTGATIVAVSVAVMFWNGIGPGPFDLFVGGIHARTGLPLAISLWITVGSLITVAWLLGRRPRPGTLVAPFLIGPVMQWSLGLMERVDRPSVLPVQVLVQLVAIAGVGVGVGALVVSGLGAGTGELLASATSTRTGRPEPVVRTVLELTWLTLGIVLGGPVGIGTVIVALSIGHAVSRGYRFVDGGVTAFRQRAAMARAELVGAETSPALTARQPVCA
jgi:uncharacterized membrane protein YczE